MILDVLSTVGCPCAHKDNQQLMMSSKQVPVSKSNQKKKKKKWCTQHNIL